MVRFFGKQRKPTGSAQAAEKPARRVKIEALPTPKQGKAEKKPASTTTRRRTTAVRQRPPRRDWAAEAAAVPAGAPAPKPASLAASPQPLTDVNGATAAPSKRRRGTRGGR